MEINFSRKQWWGIGRAVQYLDQRDHRQRVRPLHAQWKKILKRIEKALAKHVCRFKYDKPAPWPCYGLCRCGNRVYRQVSYRPRGGRLSFGTSDLSEAQNRPHGKPNPRKKKKKK